MTVALIIVNVALFLLNYIFSPPDKNIPHDLGSLTTMLAASNETLTHPWLWWQFLTYGFVHASLQHILLNMLQLFFLGKYVEDLYGKWEFLRLYVAMLLAGSVVWAAGEIIFQRSVPGLHLTLGASGAVCGVVMLFVLNYPDAKLVLFPIPIPMKAWVMGVLLIIMNVGLAIVPSSYGGNIAWNVHLAGIAFAYLYFRGHWNLGHLFHTLAQKPKFISRPKLRVHAPEEDSEPLDLNDEVDRILDKINQQGEKSLTKQERRLLEIASRKYQKRKKE